jgi:hypothetical protein
MITMTTIKIGFNGERKEASLRWWDDTLFGGREESGGSARDPGRYM